MKVPFSWLKEFVDIDVTAQELEEKLFSCGFEVEELIPLDAGISKVVVGKIVEMEKQEGTHLTKCVVDCGDYGHDIRISTGAANMKLGDCVPAALDGSTLPGGIKIKARKMQGVESNGMLCSGEELGLNDDLFPGSEVYGLLILPEDSVPVPTSFTAAAARFAARTVRSSSASCWIKTASKFSPTMVSRP